MNTMFTDTLNILLVEDNRDDYKIVRDLLREIDPERFVLEWAENYESGLEAIREQRHDLILLASSLSGRIGPEMLAETLAASPRTPVILMIDHADHDIEALAIEAGAADYLVKGSLNADLLKRAIRYCVEISRLNRICGPEAGTFEQRRTRVSQERTSHEMLATWESMTDAFFIIDTQWRFTYINSHATLLLHKTREELIGVYIWDAFPEAVGTTASYREYHRAFAEQVGVSFEEYYPPLGKWLEVHAYPSTVGLSVYFRDVTDRKQAEVALRLANDELELRVLERTAQLENSNQKLRAAKEEAEWANAAKSDFLSRMSHELRTPLNSMLGFAQLMEMDAPTDKQAVRIGHIVRAGQHLLKLINEVLDLARVESGRLQISSESIHLGICIQNAVDMIRPLCDQRGQQIIYDSGRCEPLYVQADRHRLSQVLINLLSNATKYNRDGGVILVHCDRYDGWQRISVGDSGAGIPPEQIAKLFQPFERLGSDTGPIEGTGLGLALSKRLVELMGGTLSVESKVGVGSTFVVDLPHAENLKREIGAISSRQELSSAGGRQREGLQAGPGEVG